MYFNGNENDNSLKRFRIAVTGATGMVGSHLCARLVSLGCTDIIIPVRSIESLSKLRDTFRREGVPFYDKLFRVCVTGLGDSPALALLLRGVDYVFNCAANVSIGGADGRELIDSNVGIVRSIVSACVDAKVKRLLHVSSVATLGEPAAGKECADETTHINNIGKANPYAVSKFLSESEVMKGALEGLETVVVNPATILGAGDWKGGSSSIIPFLCRGIPFYTEGVTAFVDARDVAGALTALAVCPAANGERFVLAAENISYRDLMTMATETAGRKKPWIKVGKVPMNLATGIGGIISAVSGKKNRLTPELTRILLNKHCYDGGKIKKTVNFEYTPLRETIGRVTRQYIAGE